MTTHTYTHTHTHGCAYLGPSQKAQRPKRGPIHHRSLADSTASTRRHAHTRTHTHIRAHYALLPDLASDRICTLAALVMIVVKCHCPLPTANTQLPIARLALLGPFCTSHDSTVACTVSEPSCSLVRDIHLHSFLLSVFFFPFFILTRLSTLHCIQSAQDQKRPTHPCNSCTSACHGKYP